MKLGSHDLVPYIRAAANAVRKPFYLGERNLLDYIILYVQEGNLRVTFTGTQQKQIVSPGQFCFLQPGDIHVLEGLNDTISPFVHMDLFYQPNRELSFITLPGQINLQQHVHLLQPRLSDVGGIAVPSLFTPNKPREFKETLLTLIETWRDGACGTRGQIQAHQAALSLIYQLLDTYMADESVTVIRNKLLNWVTSYLALHISEPLLVGDMAKRANLSVPRFNVVFREFFGSSPYRYFLNMKLKQTQDLLRNESLTLSEIADHYGFTDVHHFSNSFKKAFGMTPGQYRSSSRSRDVSQERN